MSELQNLLTTSEGNPSGTINHNNDNEINATSYPSSISSQSPQSLLNTESNETKIKKQTNKVANGDTKQIKVIKTFFISYL